MRQFDVIVVGAGGVGGAALYHLAKRGVRAIGLDRFPPGHDRGSSHGQTRIIRQAYFEHSDYVPLLLHAYELWAELAERRRETLYVEAGLLQVGPENGEVVPGVMKAAALHNLSVVKMSAADAMNLFPTFAIPAELSAVFEPRAGYLHVEACVRAHIESAMELGAAFADGGAVLGWKADGAGYIVETEKETFRAGGLIIAPGSWAPGLLPNLPVRLEVRRKPLYWHPTTTTGYRVEHRCPTFLFELPHGVFYGFPQIDDRGVKVAEHTGGKVVVEPLNVDRTEDVGETKRVDSFLADHLPGVASPHTGFAVCMYTMSPDEHFIVDRYPGHDRIVFAAGLSGHGFKFTSCLGEALVEMLLDGRSRMPIEFLSLKRFNGAE